MRLTKATLTVPSRQTCTAVSEAGAVASTQILSRQPEHLGEDDHDRLAVGRDDDGPARSTALRWCRQNPRGQVLVRLTAGLGVCRVVPEPPQLLRTPGHEVAHRDAIPVPEAPLVPVAVLDRVDPEASATARPVSLGTGQRGGEDDRLAGVDELGDPRPAAAAWARPFGGQGRVGAAAAVEAAVDRERGDPMAGPG